MTQHVLMCSYSHSRGARFVSTAESLIWAVFGIVLERLTVILQVHKKQVKNATLHSTHTYTECCWRNRADVRCWSMGITENAESEFLLHD